MKKGSKPGGGQSEVDIAGCDTQVEAGELVTEEITKGDKAVTAGAPTT